MDKRTEAPLSAVLVVEDDALLLMDAMDLVSEAGLTAYGARNARSALNLLDRHPGIGILFTDVQMPGAMDGLKLAHAIRERRPDMAIIVVSGHLKVTADQMPAGSVFFSKPYSPDDIVRTLTRIAR